MSGGFVNAKGQTISQWVTGVAKVLPDANRAGVTAAALDLTTTMRAAIARDTGGDSKLSGVRNAKVGARYDVKGTLNPTALVRGTGPLHLLANPTKPHTIGPRRRRGQGRRAILTPEGPRARAAHPGTPGKKTWQRTIMTARPEVPPSFQRAWRREMAKHLR